MRKLLLGTTAVVTAVLGSAAVTTASAQQAPTVRIGGSIQAYWGYINQTSGLSEPGVATIGGVPANGINAALPNSLPLNPVGGLAAGPAAVAAPGNFARLGKHDFITLPQFSVIVTGKLANGLTYGGNIDLTFNQAEGRAILQNRNGFSRSTPGVDEAYIFVAHPRFGQVRFGDEDGPMGGLMNSGWVTGFGTGGVFGVWENFQTRQGGNRTQNAPGGIGDNTKIVYMTPQFFGFDFGASYAPNYGSFGQHGCVNDGATSWCDRAYAFRGATGAAIPVSGGEQAARRNEFQVAGRWRGNLAGVGLATTVGYIHSGAARDLTLGGTQVRTLNDLGVFQVGAQASFMGFTLGAAYNTGDFNFFWGNTTRGDRRGEQLVGGLAYTAGPLTVGANFTNSLVEGGSRNGFNATTGALTPIVANAARQRRWGFGVGGNYTLAPGLSLIAEYVHHSIREAGRDLDAQRAGIQSRSFSNTFILGTRLAF